MKSIEQMAREKIELYMRPLFIGDKMISNGHTLEVAVKKAKAAMVGWDDLFDKVSKSMA